MAISRTPPVAPDPRVRRVTLEHWDAYTDAAVKMYTEEVGVSPVQGNPAGYRFYVRQLITSGRAFGIFERRPGALQGRSRLGLRHRSARCRASGSIPSSAAAAWPRPRWRRSSSWPAPWCRPSRSTSTTTTCRPGRPTRGSASTEVGEFATVHY